MFALSLTWWNQSKVLAQRPRPDIAYAANQAVSALQDDFMAPSTATISAALIDLIGRPTKLATGNILTVGRMVALAYSFGLNRDPSSWQIPKDAQRLRILLWWGVVIHDHWSSYAHGTPVIISSDRYDVSLPENFSTNIGSGYDRSGQQSFQQLCCLTQILGDLLPLVYSLRLDKDSSTAILKQVERALAERETIIKFSLSIQPEFEPPTGYCSLWLSYLSIQILLQRVSLKLIDRNPGLLAAPDRHARSQSLKKFLVTTVDFIVALLPNHLQEFWLPYTSYFVTMTATLLFRCMIEAKDDQDRQSCEAKLLDLYHFLQKASTIYSWDLADICLERCGEAFNRLKHRTETAASMSLRTLQSCRTDQLEQGRSSSHPRADEDLMEISGLADWNSLFSLDSLDLSWGILNDSNDMNNCETLP